jgi:hypothetical protein
MLLLVMFRHPFILSSKSLQIDLFKFSNTSILILSVLIAIHFLLNAMSNFLASDFASVKAYSFSFNLAFRSINSFSLCEIVAFNILN